QLPSPHPPPPSARPRPARPAGEGVRQLPSPHPPPPSARPRPARPAGEGVLWLRPDKLAGVRSPATVATLENRATDEVTAASSRSPLSGCARARAREKEPPGLPFSRGAKGLDEPALSRLASEARM